MAPEKLFKNEGPHDFANLNPADGYGSPVFVVAVVAKQAITDGLDIELPKGTDIEFLEELLGNEPHVGDGSLIRNSTGKDLAQIGEQILRLHYEGVIQPPLQQPRRVLIEQLVSVVNATETLPRGETEFI